MIDAPQIPVAIIGAGPFGLSIAAHLRYNGIPFRIFGFPMHRWRNEMPAGMFLKSEGIASSLSDPAGRFTLARFCAENQIPYADRGLPVPIAVFTDYALAFQRELVPSVEEILVSQIRRVAGGFELDLKNGARVRARKVIVATGLEHTAYIPPVFSHLPRTAVSHSGDHRDLECFKGRDVTVIGAGQSALETAALLAEAGIGVRVIARRAALQWNEPPRLGPRSLYARVRRPLSGLGEGLQLWLFCNTPGLFRHLPVRLRVFKVKTVLDAAGAWWLRSRIRGKVEVLCGSNVMRAEARDGGLVLQVSRGGNATSEWKTDHVIAATGFRYDIRRLPFLGEELIRQIRTEDDRPVVSQKYESTMPGLYFAGMATAYSFGPGMRFIDGTAYTARTLSAHLCSAQNQAAEVCSGRVTAVST